MDLLTIIKFIFNLDILYTFIFFSLIGFSLISTLYLNDSNSSFSYTFVIVAVNYTQCVWHASALSCVSHMKSPVCAIYAISCEAHMNFREQPTKMGLHSSEHFNEKKATYLKESKDGYLGKLWKEEMEGRNDLILYNPQI